MQMKLFHCNGCGRIISSTEHAIKFMCPSCGGTEVWRCERCRKFGRTYRCPKCDFIGP